MLMVPLAHVPSLGWGALSPVGCREPSSHLHVLGTKSWWHHQLQTVTCVWLALGGCERGQVLSWAPCSWWVPWGRSALLSLPPALPTMQGSCWEVPVAGLGMVDQVRQ